MNLLGRYWHKADISTAPANVRCRDRERGSGCLIDIRSVVLLLRTTRGAGVGLALRQRSETIANKERAACVYRKSDSAISVMKAAKDGA